MLKESFFSQIAQDDKFQILVHPIPEDNSKIRDAEFYIRRDGIIFNTDGYAHPADELVGNVLYTPDRDGKKRFFGVNYRKIFFDPTAHEPVPYNQRAKILQGIDPVLDQSKINSWPFR